MALSVQRMHFLLLILSMMLFNGVSSVSAAPVNEIQYEKADSLEEAIKENLSNNPRKSDSLSTVFLDLIAGKNDTLESMGWYYRAESAYYSGQFSRAGDYYQRALELLDSIDAPEKKAIFYNNLGLTRYYKERYNEALAAFSESAKIEKKQGNEYGFAQCLHNIALIQDKAGDSVKAEHYFQHAQNAFIEMDSIVAAAAVSNDYAIFLSDLGRNRNAIRMYQRALELYEELEDWEGIAKVKCNMGALHLYEKNYVRSARLLDESLEYFKEQQDESYLINIYSLLGDLYFEQGRSALSVVFYERAENIANRMGWDDLRKKNLYSLYEALKSEEDYQRAMIVLETYSYLKDSLIVANNAYVEESLDNDVETELMKQELQLTKAKMREKNLILIILGLMVVFGVGAWLLYGRNRLLHHQQKNQMMQQKMMRIQMDPHFVFNALSSLQNYILSDDKNEASEYLSDIAFLMRKILGYADVELITLNEEIDVLKKYLNVQCRRYYETLDCGIRCEIISGSQVLKVPPLLSRPLIDDFFANGKKNDFCCPGISIIYEQKQGELEVTIENKGIVVPDEKSFTNYEVIRERLSSMRREHKGGRDTLERVDIINDGKISGTRIRYWLPVIQ